MRLNVTIEKQKDGTYIAYNTNDDEVVLVGNGSTVNGAKDDFFNSMHETVDACKENGIPIPCSLNEEPVFKFDIASLFEYYNMINVSALARYLGINETLMRQYKKGDTYISENQLKRIEDGIHVLGEELSRLKLVQPPALDFRHMRAPDSRFRCSFLYPTPTVPGFLLYINPKKYLV